MSRRAKIVCTIGPVTATPAGIRSLVDAGMDIARLNFSHGTRDDHARVYELVRKASDETGRAVAVLADLQGPKIRLGRFAGGIAQWPIGAPVVLTSDDVLGTAERVSVTYPRLPAEVRPGDRLLVDDGRLALQVRGVRGNDIDCLVTEGGTVSDHKGLSLPNVAISAPALSEKDAADLRFALGMQVDLVALSFVRSPDDIKPLHEIMAEVGRRLPVLAKIEKPEAVDRLEEIAKTFDGMMVARGDLGVELPLEQVPLVQKRAVGLCREYAKPVIVATQMLDSMISDPRPTRAEASDVANAVLDGADALMLSGETSIGRYPVPAVHTMASIITTTESGEFAVPPMRHGPRTIGGAVTEAAVYIAESVGAKALVAFTKTGETVRRMARLHCPLPLLAFTTEQAVRSQLALSWGVETFLTPVVRHTDEMFRQVDHALLELGRGKLGDAVVIVAGSPPGTPGSTNTVRVHHLGSLSEAL